MNSIEVNGWRTVAGGFCIHLVLGTLYCWANITSAVTSNLRRYQSNVTYDDTISVYATELVAQGCTMLVGGLVGQRIGARKCAIIGSIFLLAATFASSMCKTLSSLVFCQGIMFGMGIGLNYTTPIWASVQWMPHRKGLVTGIIVAGFGCGAFIFGLIATHIVNPHQETVNSEGPNKGYFSPDSDVVKNVPKMFHVLGACYFCFLCIGCALMVDPIQISDVRKRFSSSIDGVKTYQSTALNDEEITIDFNSNPLREIELSDTIHDQGSSFNIENPNTNYVESKENDITTKEILSMPLAWHISSCLVTTTIGGMYMAGIFKTFGQAHIHNEIFLSTVSAFSSIFNTLGRIWWGFWADRLGALRTLLFISFIFSIIILTFPLSFQFGEVGFALWTFSIFFFEGANFVLYYPIVVSCFGEKYSASNYGLIFSVYSFFAMINIIVVSHSGMEFSTSAILMGCITFLGFMNLISLHFHVRSISKMI